ncbi:MAG: hypothetical protein II921_07550 [Treponema sp.]|nr:hypothetical protein [Treponema sp.]
MKSVHRIWCIVIFVILACTSLLVASLVLKSYDNYPKFKPFFIDKKTEYDAYFFGASNALNGIFPMQLWEDHRITSYNFAWHKSSIALDYWLLRLTSRMKKPKIVFIDIFGIDGEQKIDKNLYYAHGALDLFPLSAEKLCAINDLFDTPAKKAEFIFPFYLYHNSWKTTSLPTIKSNTRHFLTKRDALIPTRGGELRVGTTYPENFDTHVRDFSETEPLSFKYAKKIISFCRENDILPVFMLVPYPTQDALDEWKDSFIRLLEKEKVDFLDLSCAVDFDTDKFDRFAHLNPSGASKVTEQIGAYILKSAEAIGASEKDGDTRVLWEKDLARYHAFYDGKIIDETHFSNLLTLLSNQAYKADIFVSDGVELGEIEKKLINQMGKNVTVHIEPKADDDIKIKVFKAKSPQKDGTTDETFFCEKSFRAQTIKIQ